MILYRRHWAPLPRVQSSILWLIFLIEILARNEMPVLNMEAAPRHSTCLIIGYHLVAFQIFEAGVFRSTIPLFAALITASIQIWMRPKKSFVSFSSGDSVNRWRKNRPNALLISCNFCLYNWLFFICKLIIRYDRRFWLDALSVK